MKKLLATAGLWMVLLQPLRAEMWDTLCIEPHRIDTTLVGALQAKVDALLFLHNNEFSSQLAKGYTLPGAWLQPKLVYTPISQIRLEAGAHLMLFDGANRYPNYAFHDVSRWKGHQYQHGVHALPWLRAQADFRRLTLVLGNLYGAQNHRLVLPLFNPEQNLSTDPEMGFQLLWQKPRNHMDLWINWQSYIFNLDTHQEAFTVGLNNTLCWNPSSQAPIRWETPLQLLVQHRGGELDTTEVGVQTVCNAAIGLRMTYSPHPAASRKQVLSSLRAQVNALVSYQQHGTLWPFDTGFALHAAFAATLWRDLTLEAGYVGIPRQYANLYGLPFFSTLSIRHQGLALRGLHTPYLTAAYAHAFTPAYRLGAQFSLYSAHSRHAASTPLSFGVYLRLCPDFLIWRKR